MIPSDESVPLKGATFLEWEEQVAQVRQAVMPTLLEERCALEHNARVLEGGRCPFCSADGAYLKKEETRPEALSPDGPVVITKQHCRCHQCDGSFSPQDRDWSLPSEVPLTPKAARKLAREVAKDTFGPAAKSLNDDWDTQFDPTQIQRWGEAIGKRAVAERDAEVAACEAGTRPTPPANAPALIVVGLDGGRVQMRDKDPDSKSRWREDKICTVTTYLPGDGKDPEEGGRVPQKLVTTHVATMEDCKAIAKLAHVEAERRGLRQAAEVLVMGDNAPWIDSARDDHFAAYPRIADYEHGVEHLWDAARAVRSPDTPQSPEVAALEAEWETLIYDGKADEVIQRMRVEAQALGPVQETDGPQHPRRMLENEIGFFERNKAHMNYPEYRRKGWPIGSGNTEAGVKQFNRRVKGTDQFWNKPGVEAILTLRGLWISQDERWEKYWKSRPAYSKVA